MKAKNTLQHLEMKADLNYVLGMNIVFSVVKYFYNVFNKIPNRITDYDIRWKIFLESLKEIYKDLHEQQVYDNTSTQQFKGGDKLVDRVYYLEDDLLINVYHISNNFEYSSVEILYSRDIQFGKVERIRKLLDKHRVKQGGMNRSILMLVKDSRNLDMEFKRFELPKSIDSIDNHYNEDFYPINNLILERLNTNNASGLVILHGLPGTGKTSYVRYLLGHTNRRFLFVPPSMANQISNPEMINMLMEYPNSVLVIEDAENALLDRKMGINSESTSNILNLTDGVLGMCLNMLVICTINIDVSMIDKALLRKGRLISIYEFKELAPERCNIILEKMGGDYTVSEPTTLANLYNFNTVQSNLTARKTIGFKG